MSEFGNERLFTWVDVSTLTAEQKLALIETPSLLQSASDEQIIKRLCELAIEMNLSKSKV